MLELGLTNETVAIMGEEERDVESGGLDRRNVQFSERSERSQRSSARSLSASGHGRRDSQCVANVRRISDAQPRRRQLIQVGKIFTAVGDKLGMTKVEEEEDEEDKEKFEISRNGRFMIQKAQRFDDIDVSQQQPHTQYRLSRPTPPSIGIFRYLKWFGISPGTGGIYDDSRGGEISTGFKICGLSPNNMVVNYLNWSFRGSFFQVLFTAAVGFFGWTIFFAILMFWSGRNKVDCLTVNGYYFNGTASDFADAYALSWTTFSTVGYGLVYPSTSTSHRDSSRSDCAPIQMLCTLESFVGILFASFCGAIIFGKVTRLRSHAQVIFSDPIVIRYGTGVEVQGDSDSSSTEEENLVCLRHTKPPVIEFRVVNRLHNIPGGEIMDATMNIVATIDESQASPAVRSAVRGGGRRRKGKKRGARPGLGAKRASLRGISSRGFHNPTPAAIPETGSLHGNATKPPFEMSDQHYHSSNESLDLTDILAPKIKATAPHQHMDDSAGGTPIPKKIFSKLEVDTPDHPFFKRVWVVKHTLDRHSPLLTQEARRKVTRNRGNWPGELNNYEAIRASIRFDQILVSMSGTSNADASSVYAQKCYDFVDVNVGYRFVNILYRDPRNDRLCVDTEYINDVLEQYGGGAEPFAVANDSDRPREIYV